MVGVEVDEVVLDWVGVAVEEDRRFGKVAGLSDVRRLFRLLEVLELFEVIVSKCRLSVAAYRRDGDEVEVEVVDMEAGRAMGSDDFPTLDHLGKMSSLDWCLVSGEVTS